jgi:hypothetical protein
MMSPPKVAAKKAAPNLPLADRCSALWFASQTTAVAGDGEKGGGGVFFVQGGCEMGEVITSKVVPYIRVYHI